MRRPLVLGAVLLGGACSATLAALQAPAAQQAANVVQVDKIADNLFVMKGGGGNSAVFITAGGVVVVDTKNPGWGQPLLDGIRSVTSKPVTMIVNTHSHGDHVSGNVDFPATVEVVTHENTKRNMEAMRPASFVTPPPGGPPPNVFTQSNGRGLPKRTYQDSLTIGQGADRIELHYFGRAHTNGDTFVVFPSLRVMHTGDTFPNQGPPGMDSNNGGSGTEFAATMRKAADHAERGNIDTIINGHRDRPSTRAELREYAEFVNDYVSHAQAAKKAGKSVAEAVTGWKVPEEYKGYSTTPNAVRDSTNFELIYRETR